MSELISCIVPVYNGAAHLGAALDSVLGQAHRPLEVVVVDNASTDDSAAIARERGENVRVVGLESNRGPAGARAAGVAAARGELISFLDADDLWAGEKLARQLPHLAGPPRLDASFALIENFWEPGLEAEAERWRRAGRMRSAYHFGTLLARRELFERVPIAAELRHTDIQDWVMRARERRARIGALEEVLAFRRRHSDNVTRTDASEAIYDEYLSLIKARLDQRRAQGA